MTYPIKLRQFRTQFPLETPSGVSSSFVVGENVKSIELHENGAVFMQGHGKAWVIIGNAIGFVAEDKSAAAKTAAAKTARSRGANSATQ